MMARGVPAPGRDDCAEGLGDMARQPGLADRGDVRQRPIASGAADGDAAQAAAAHVRHCAGRDKQRVTIRRCPRHRFRAYDAAAARTVVDHHGLSPRLEKFLAEYARQRIAAAACRIRRNHAYGLHGIGRFSRLRRNPLNRLSESFPCAMLPVSLD